MNPPPPLLSPQLLPAIAAATAAAPPIFLDYSPPSLSESLPSLKPNLAIILVGLGFTFMLVCAFALFAKCMNPHFQRRREQQMGWLESDGSTRGGGAVGAGHGGHKDGAGVDPAVIAALPLILYKPRRAALGGVPSLKRSGSTGAELLDKALALGGAGGSTGKAAAAAMRYQELEGECAVCLSAFEEGEQLRQLPECRHAFHPACVDSWLGTHPSCPLCRRSILPKAADKPDKAPAVFVPQESQRLRLGELSDALAPQSTAALPPRSPPPRSPPPAASASSSSSRVDAAAPAVVVVPEIVVMGGDLPWPLPTRSPAQSPVAPLPAGPSPGFVAVPEAPVVERAGAGAGGGTNSGLPPPASPNGRASS